MLSSALSYQNAYKIATGDIIVPLCLAF